MHVGDWLMGALNQIKIYEHGSEWWTVTEASDKKVVSIDGESGELEYELRKKRSGCNESVVNV